MPSSVMLRCPALVTTNFSEERSASIISVTRIGELRKTLDVALACIGCLLSLTLFPVHRFLLPW
jgi:hypothetical protein